MTAGKLLGIHLLTLDTYITFTSVKFGRFCGEENYFKMCYLNCRRHLRVDYSIT